MTHGNPTQQCADQHIHVTPPQHEEPHVHSHVDGTPTHSKTRPDQWALPQGAQNQERLQGQRTEQTQPGQGMAKERITMDCGKTS